MSNDVLPKTGKAWSLRKIVATICVVTIVGIVLYSLTLSIYTDIEVSSMMWPFVLWDNLSVEALLKAISFKVLLMALFTAGFQLPLPLLALIISLSSKSKLVQIHAMVLVCLYAVFIPFFWIIASGEASKDAQGALIYVFGPIYLQMLCVFGLGIFTLAYYILRLIRRKFR